MLQVMLLGCIYLFFLISFFKPNDIPNFVNFKLKEKKTFTRFFFFPFELKIQRISFVAVIESKHLLI